MGKRESKGPKREAQTRFSATEFKARCLALMDRVRRTREEIVVTKHGRPVAKLVPYGEEAPAVFGHLRGTVGAYGDLVTPIGVAWEADSGDEPEDDRAGTASRGEDETP